MMKLYLVRHGETELNRKKVYQGWIDSDLSEEGKKQCESLKHRLGSEDFSVVITSPLKRAVQSAEILTNKKAQDFIICEDFKELNFGQWEAMHYSDIEKQYPVEWDLWCKDWINYTIPEGENFNRFYERVEKALKVMLKTHESKNILLVSHEGVLKVIILVLLNLNLEYYWKFNFQFGRYSEFHIAGEDINVSKINA